ncbi:MAG: tetratricopeptide (TPR) repeat protein [Psychroserpens sp.]|jgi:tetratricopeptide (TPR) repeat protein
MKKTVFIHVGPPKTGTSAIQNWFSKNAVMLLTKGLYYPVHALDPNGVSSGNLNSICDIVHPEEVCKSAKISVSKDKVMSLLEDFNESDCHCLLLSSEFFIQHMAALKNMIPSVCFIAYLRNPIEILESNYNQGVKRAGFTHPINLASFNKIPHINYLLDYVDKFNRESLLLRFYDVSFNGTNNLIDDVLTVLGIEGITVYRKSVNNSYHFEAMEFKRWLNNFKLGDLANKVDHALQSFNTGLGKFSLIPPDRYEGIKNNYYFLIDDAFEKLALNRNFNQFSDTFSGQSQTPYKEQKLEKDEFFLIMRFLKKTLQQDFEALCNIVNESPSGVNSEHFEWFKEMQFSNSQSTFNKIKDKLRRKLTKGDVLQAQKRVVETVLPSIVGLNKFRKVTEVPSNVHNAKLLRELALFSESNGQLEFAILLLEKAIELRPDGRLIVAALEEFTEKKKTQISN